MHLTEGYEVYLLNWRENFLVPLRGLSFVSVIIIVTAKSCGFSAKKKKTIFHNFLKITVRKILIVTLNTSEDCCTQNCVCWNLKKTYINLISKVAESIRTSQSYCCKVRINNNSIDTWNWKNLHSREKTRLEIWERILVFFLCYVFCSIHKLV